MEIVNIRQIELDHYLLADWEEIFQKNEIKIDDNNIIDLIITVSKLYEQYGSISMENLQRKITMHRINSKNSVIPSSLNNAGCYENLFVLIGFFKNKAKIRTIFLDRLFNHDKSYLRKIFYIGSLSDISFFVNNIIDLILPITKKLNIEVFPIVFCGKRFSYLKHQSLLI